MLQVINGELIYEVPDKILKHSTYIKQMYSEFPNEPIPLIGSFKKFDVILDWLAIAPDVEFDENFFIFNYYFQKYNFINLDFQENIELLHFAINNQFILLANIIAEKISSYIIKYVDNKFIIKDKQISLTEALMISRYSMGKNKNNVLRYPKELLKNFKYNPTFIKDFEKCFNVETLFFKTINEMYDTSKNVCLYYGSKCLENRKIKVINKTLTGSDLKRKIKPEIINMYINANLDKIKRYLLKNFNDDYTWFLEEYRSHLKACYAMKTYLNDFIIFDKVKNTTCREYFDTNFTKRNYEIPSDIVKIEEQCFSYSPKLQNIEIPDNVTYITSSAFLCCSSLTEITLSRNIKTLPEYLLYYCTKLSSINQCGFKNKLPYIKKIEKYALASCFNLRELKIPNIKSLNISAFDRCGLSSLTIPTTIKEILNFDHFNDMFSLKHLYIPGKFINCVSNINLKLTVYCKDKIETSSIEEIQKNKLINCINGETLILSNSLITIPNYITKFYDNCFMNCLGLTSINLKSLQSLGTSVFKDCINLVRVELPDICKIPNYCFENCEKLKNISLPDTITHLGVAAFKNCKSLIELNTENIKFFSKQCFENCEKLQNITLNNIKSIPQSFMKGCKIKNITIPDVLFVGNSAFQDCKFLKNVKFNNCNKIGDYAFESCESLEEIILPNIETIPVNCFLNCYKLKKINLDSVKSIERSAFENCKSLIELNIENVKTIDEYAFSGCISLLKLNNVKVKYKPTSFLGCISLNRRF